MWVRMPSRDEEMDFNDITEVYNKESKSKKLTKIHPDFFEQVDRYRARIKEELGDVKDHDPMSVKLTILRDANKKVPKFIKKIRELRERKVALLAVLKANGGSPNIEEMTPGEVTLYRTMAALIVESRTGKARAPPEPVQEVSKPAPETPGPKEPGSTEEEPGHSIESYDGTELEGEAAADERLVVKVLDDVPAFMGEEKVYRLKKNDVVSLPMAIARVLCERGVAKSIAHR